MFRKLFSRNTPLKKVEKNLGQSYSSLNSYFPLDQSCETMIDSLKSEFQLPGLNLNISKHDLMFLNTLMSFSLASSYKAYIKTGLNARNIIIKCINALFEDKSHINSVLDFASGYGRLTRHLIHDISADRIWVSDIKKEAVDFQKSEFNVNGIPSSYYPNEFNPKTKFDLIFVGSLFSHLPQPLFEQWLHKLDSLLNENGVLIFTTLNIQYHRPESKHEFEYIENSEDKLLDFVNGAIVENDVYGMTFVSDLYMTKQLSKLGWNEGQYCVHRNGFGSRQDVYMLTKKWDEKLNTINLQQYP